MHRYERGVVVVHYTWVLGFFSSKRDNSLIYVEALQ